MARSDQKPTKPTNDEGYPINGFPLRVWRFLYLYAWSMTELDQFLNEFNARHHGQWVLDRDYPSTMPFQVFLLIDERRNRWYWLDLVPGWWIP